MDAMAQGNIYLFKLLFCCAMVSCFLLAGVMAFVRSRLVAALQVVAVGLLLLAVSWGFDAVAYSPLFSPESPFEGSIPHIAGAWGSAGLGGALIVLGLVLARGRVARKR